MKIAHIFANDNFESRGFKFEKYSEKNGIEVIPFFRKKGQSYFSYVTDTVRKILKQKLNIIHAHRISGFAPAIIVKILRPKTKIIYDKHDINKYDFIFDRLTFFADYIIVASELHYQYMKKFKDQIIIIPNYSDFKPISDKRKEEIRKEIGLKKDELMLLFQGSIVKDYGLDLLVDSLPSINKKIKLIILGWIKEPEYWEEIKKNLSDRIIYLGSKEYSEMNDYVGSADIGVVLFQKSRLTLFGNPAKLFEFFNCKIPVVVTDLECVSKYIRKYGSGIIVDNKEELADAINKMLDKKVREGFSKKSPNLPFEEEFNKYYLKILEDWKDKNE